MNLEIIATGRCIECGTDGVGVIYCDEKGGYYRDPKPRCSKCEEEPIHLEIDLSDLIKNEPRCGVGLRGLKP